MLVYNNKEYEKVWFTSDEHYGSDRHITFSGRLDFQDITKEKKIREFKQQLDQTEDLSEHAKNAIIRNYTHSVYGLTLGKSQIDKMNDEFIYRHNIRVSKNDLVFHLGDFGDYKYSEYLNGDHVLVMGNYECKDWANNYGDIVSFYDALKANYNFIECDLSASINVSNNLLFGNALRNEVDMIYMTHEPTKCKYDHKNNKYMTPDVNNDKIIMNLFGHIHDKCKIKRFGLNVGVDCHHYYPVSTEEVEFYLYAILHHYDNEVFC